jgi:hypothetical protein
VVRDATSRSVTGAEGDRAELARSLTTLRVGLGLLADGRGDDLSAPHARDLIAVLARASERTAALVARLAAEADPPHP